MVSKFWTFGISWVLLAAYLYANAYTYLPIYVPLTSVSAYPPTQLPTTHHLPIYQLTHLHSSLPCSLPPYPHPYVDAQLLTNTQPIHLHIYLCPRWMGRRAVIVPTEI